MDRRTVVFLLLVTVSLFGIRTWYAKRHETELGGRKGEQKSEQQAVPATALSEDIPAIFDLPLVYTTENPSKEVPPLLTSELIQEVTGETVSTKSAYGLAIDHNLFALVAQDDVLSWPDTLSLKWLKTKTGATIKPVQLIKAFSNAYAVYAITDVPTVPEVVATEKQCAEGLIYAVHAFQPTLSNAESYEIVPKGKINSLEDGLVVVSVVVSLGDTSSQFLPAGVISTYKGALQKQRVRELSLFIQEPFLAEQYVTAYREEVPPSESPPPKYYLLENQYQQLVFSTEHGELVEINLPFQSAHNAKSIVRPIAYDTTMTKVSPDNAYFPLQWDVLGPNNVLMTRVLGGYYPLIRRPLMSDDTASTTIARVLPPYRSSIILTSSNDGQYHVMPASYRMTDHSETSITFTGTNNRGQTITKEYSFPKEADLYPYCVDIEISFSGGQKRVAEEFAVTSGIPEIEWMSGTSGAAIGMLISKNGTRTKALERLDLPKETYLSKLQAPDWTMNSNGFFALLMKPLQSGVQGVFFKKAPGSDAPSRLVELDETGATFTEEALPGYQSALIANSMKTQRIRLFAGPLDDTLFSTIDNASQREFGTSFDFNYALTYQGWFTWISEPFARFLYFFMKQFHAIVGSWGLSIIFATLLLRILLYPLNSWSMKSMRRMQEVAPLVKGIQEKYKKDPAKAQKEIMALYSEKRVNPFSGCLPLLIQMPFLIGMFDLLKSTFALRGAPFIPGWINNLSAPDTLFQIPFHIPFLGNEFHLLPILLGGTMWIQQSMTSKLPEDPKEWTDQQRQQRTMGLIMTVMMTVLFYNFPSGLNIYWISSMLLGIIQQWWTLQKRA